MKTKILTFFRVSSANLLPPANLDKFDSPTAKNSYCGCVAKYAPARAQRHNLQQTLAP